MDYTTLKLLHVLGACLFIGNNLVTPFWRFLAERTRDPVTIAFSQRLITLTDIVFTGGGIALLLAAGHAMLARRPDLWTQSWFLWSYVLFAASGLIWLAVLLPIQVAQARMVRSFARGTAIPERFWRLARRWSIAGLLASLLPLGSLALMVLR